MTEALPKVPQLHTKQKQWVGTLLRHTEAFSNEPAAIGVKREHREEGYDARRVRALEGKCLSVAQCLSASAPTLRPYQVALVERLRAAYRVGYRALLLQLATGGGKTIIFAAAIANAHGRGKRVLVVAHRRELIRQASAKLTAAGVPHGIIAPGHPETVDPIQVGSIQTLVRRLDRLPAFDLIVLDEAHHAVAAQ
jgi:superfamily II DNA or RNA helicase